MLRRIESVFQDDKEFFWIYVNLTANIKATQPLAGINKQRKILRDIFVNYVEKFKLIA